MTVEELVNKLLSLPQESIVMYRHNKYGRIDIDTVDFQQELMVSGGYLRTVTLEGKFEEDKDVVRKFFK